MRMSPMRVDTKQIIQRIGETDQLYLEGNTPQLALERADLRLYLVTLSNLRQEQVYFLQEAVVILEQGRVEFDEMPMSVYMDLSLYLAKAYMIYYEITKELRFALITQQILKPIVSDEYGDVYFFLAYAAISKAELSMTRHWLTKYGKTAAFDASLLQEHPAFQALHTETWFIQLMRIKLH